MKPIVQLDNVTKVIRGKKIIDSMSFDIYKGEVFGLLGPNGAGKTTTIRMMVGLMKLSDGDIFIGGKSIRTQFEQAVQHVGAIIENPEMYAFLSGYDNLRHFAKMSKGVTKLEIDEIVELVGLKERIHDKVKSYSLGMRQRLGLAQCLLHKPNVLILDEPTNGLDPAGIREMRDHLRNLAKEKNMAILVSSHLLSEMEMMCDRIGIIQKGKLIEVQRVSDFVQGADKEFLFEVSEVARANEIIRMEYRCEVVGANLTVTTSKEEIPNLISMLVHHGVKIFGVREVTKSLEDRFLEVTGETEAKLHV